MADTVNCRPSAGAVTDGATDTKLGTASAKLATLLAKQCTGVDVSTLNFGPPCDDVTDLPGLTTCVDEDAHGAFAENLAITVFGTTGALTFPAVKDELLCLKTAAKSAAKHADARVKARAKCAKSLAAGKIAGPCPDAKARVFLAKSLAKFTSGVGKRCGFNQLNSTTLQPGFPCDLYKSSTFLRGSGNNNAAPLNQVFARCLSAASAGAGDAASDVASPLPDADPFSLGVAAGDATDKAFVAWTRTADPSDVTLEVATDDAFTAIVDTIVETPDAAADGAVKIDVTGLSAGTDYFYRFSQSGSTSRTGRIQTAVASPVVDSFTFAFTGDSNAAFKPFSVVERITEADPDVWLYIGDTIYGDDTRSGSGIATVRSEYHDKYEENRDDRALRDLMANVGFYTIWDDHEVTNDFYGTDAAIAAQMAEGNQAFRDYMPIRENVGDAEQLYRSFVWGDVAEFFLIDTRQYRDAQAYVGEPTCTTGSCSVSEVACFTQPDCDASGGGQVCHKGTCSVTTATACSVDGDCPVSETCEPLGPDALPGAACKTVIDDPGRTYLGATQLQWLKDGLDASTATFKFVMNGPLISSLLFVPYDRWDGYTAERTDLIDHITTNSIDNVVFLSTDIHAAIYNTSVESSSVREVVAGAVGMDPIVRELPASILAQVDNLPLLFPTVDYYDIDRFNVALIDVSHDEAVIEWRDGSGQIMQEITLPAAP